MRRLTLAVLGLGLAVFAPSAANAMPTCTSISVVLLPGYQCRIGGLLFGGFNWNVYTQTQGLASVSGPSSYNLAFNWVGNQVTLTYQPVGGSAIRAQAQNDPNDPSSFGLAYYQPTLEYDVTVDPTVPGSGLLGASAHYGRPRLQASGAGLAYGGHQGFLQSNEGAGITAYSEAYYFANYGAPYGSVIGANPCGPGGTNVSNSPLKTGNIFCTALASGLTRHFKSLNFVTAYVDPNAATYAPGGSASASASVNAAWSNVFTTTTVSPEPATFGLLGVGLAVLLALRGSRPRV